MTRAVHAFLASVLLLVGGFPGVACSDAGHGGQPFATPFGVGVAPEYAPGLEAPLDTIGPVWYLDWKWDTPSIDGHQRLYVIRCWEAEVNRDAYQEALRASGDAWWSLGNEPNDAHQDNVSPDDYAQLYRLLEVSQQPAPRVHLVPAGIANADWQWAEAFREAFWARYGRYPRVDAWNIHNYILKADQDPYDVAEFKRRIEDFRAWMSRIGDGAKPLLLTEFGVLYGDGCCGRPVDPPEKIQAFMRETVAWLVESEQVSAWAWFSTRCEPYNGDLMTAEGALTDLGLVYRDLVRAYAAP